MGIIIIGFFAIGHYFILDSFAQSTDKSSGMIASEIIASIMVFSIFGIPVIIISSIILKAKKKISGKSLKIILAGMGALVLILIIGMIVSQSSWTDEEKVTRDAVREEKEIQKELELKQQEAELEQSEIQRLGDDAFADAKKRLDAYLASLKKGVIECNKVPDSVKIASLVRDDAEEIIVNSALMILIIEEVEKKGYDGLSPYKQKIMTSVDELTQCLNRH